MAETETRVEIFGNAYTLKGEGDDAYLKELAGYVDQQMRTLAAGMGTPAAPLKVAILAAVHMADELHQLRKRVEALERLLEETAKELAGALEQAP